MASTKAEFITYTDKELAAIEILRANAGQHLSAADLGIAVGTLTSLYKKSIDPRPMAEGLERVVLNKEDSTVVVEVEKPCKLYWI